MRKSISGITSGVGTILHSLIVPIFVLVFAIYYRPHGVYELLSMDNASFTFNVTILFCIVLVSVSITRGWLYILAKYKDVTTSLYAVWCVGETVIASLFCALYIVLMSSADMTFFELAGLTFVNLLAMVIYPYAFLWSGFEYSSQKNEGLPQAEDNSLIRFCDEYKKLRLVIAPEAVMFIKSEDNYVQIHYIDQNRPKKFILRSSMRALEDNLSKHGLVRCHRSFFINPSFIKIVHRDSSGLIVAELNRDGFESIPISRKYQDTITRLL